LRFSSQSRLKQFELLAHDVEIIDRIAPACIRNIDEMDENLGSFEVPEELMTEPQPLMGALDETWNVGHRKTAITVEAHDAQVRRQGREGIVRNLRMGR